METSMQQVKGYGNRIAMPVLPEIGSAVKFYPRVGEGAGRQPCYPAMVKSTEPSGNATILVFYASDDIREVTVPPRDEQNPRGWELVSAVAEPEIDEGDANQGAIDVLMKRITDLEGAVAALSKPKAKAKAPTKAKGARR